MDPAHFRYESFYQCPHIHYSTSHVKKKQMKKQLQNYNPQSIFLQVCVFICESSIMNKTMLHFHASILFHASRRDQFKEGRGWSKREEKYRSIQLFNLHGFRYGYLPQCVMNCLRMRHEVVSLGFDLLRQILRGMCPCRKMNVRICEGKMKHLCKCVIFYRGLSVATSAPSE